MCGLRWHLATICELVDGSVDNAADSDKESDISQYTGPLRFVVVAKKAKRKNACGSDDCKRVHVR